MALLSSSPEVQYVTLRNILLIIQRRPAVLKNEVRVFFCKYNDPIYVKLAKLEIMYRLARAENAAEVLAELQEWVFFSAFVHNSSTRLWQIRFRSRHRLCAESSTINRSFSYQSRSSCRSVYSSPSQPFGNEGYICCSRSHHRDKGHLPAVSWAIRRNNT